MVQKSWHRYLGFLVVVTLAYGSGALATAQEVQEDEGQIIQIAPDRDGDGDFRGLRERRVTQPGFRDNPPQPAPRFWIGLVGGPVSDALRHHVDLPPGQGLLVMDVVPDSPAAEAGLQKHDILLRAGDIDLDEMRDLVELVRTEGERQGQIVIEITRHGQRETVWVSPTERPAGAFPRRQEFGGGQPGQFGGPGIGAGDLQGLFGRIFGDGERGGRFRHFGPGVFVGGQQMNFTQLPDGTSVKVEKQNNGPTKITVERNGETWQIEGDEPEALDQLPDDIRPFVEQMVRGGPRVNLPDFGEGFGGQAPQFEQWMPQDGNLQQWQREIEERVRELQERLSGPQLGPPADEEAR